MTHNNSLTLSIMIQLIPDRCQFFPNFQRTEISAGIYSNKFVIKYK